MSNRFINSEIYSEECLENIDSLQMCVFPHNYINKGAVVDVLTSDTYDGDIPKSNALFDTKMGANDEQFICPIDERDTYTCPGYFGKLELALPLFNLNYIEYVEKLLKCICFRCSNILIDKTNPVILRQLNGLTRLNRLNKIVKMLKKKAKKCIHNNGCFVTQPTKYVKKTIDKIQEKDHIVKIVGIFDQSAFKNPNLSNEHVFTPESCYRIFKKITDEDVEFLGFSKENSRPEWFIIKNMPIPPPSMRPSIRQNNNQRSEDDLTYIISNIVKQNSQLRQKLVNASRKDASIYYGLLQYYSATFMNNEISGVAPIAQRTSMRPLKSLTQRLKAKEGRMRWNIQGKRVDFSARTVISVDPNIDIDEWGVPIKIAMNLTYPEIADKYNINRLYKAIRNGPDKYPGANSLSKCKFDDLGNKEIIEYRLSSIDLNNIKIDYGDIVNRHLIDGDICLFNRQPSLHRMSMLAHKIKVMPNNTFKLNISVTNPYNADFDGDEMNMHVPQSIMCTEELKRIALVSNNIISPGNSRPIVIIVQDTVIGSYLFTNKEEGTKINKRDLYNLMMFDNKYNGKLPTPEISENGKEYWSGNQVFSLILPDISINTKNISVKRGIIKKGLVDDSSLSSNSKGFIHQIYNAYGTKKCKNFLNDAQNLITKFLTYKSFSIGYGDCLLPKENINMKNKIIKDELDEIKKLFNKAQDGIYKPELDKSLIRDAIENDILSHLDKIMEKLNSNIMSNLEKSGTNNFFKAVSSGSKGKDTNIGQIMCCVGQQRIWGTRIGNGYSDRALPHFGRFDISPHALGFVSNSFSNGLDPAENYFSAVGGRIGVIDTAVKTADTGYVSRKLIKATEDLMVNYDGTVRNSTDCVLQFEYGSDKYDTMKLEKIKNKFMTFDNNQMERFYKYDEIDNNEYWEEFMTDEAVNELINTPGYKQLLIDEFNNLFKMRDTIRQKYYSNISFKEDAYCYLPVNLDRLITIVKDKSDINNNCVSDMTPLYIIEKVNNLMEDICKYTSDKNEGSLELHKSMYMCYLNSKKILCHYHLNKVTFDFLLANIKKKIYSSMINPGEMVGIIASQTLGEQSTQLTLNTFHLSGVGSAAKVITQGMPRLNEIMRLSDNMKNKAMEIYLKDEYKKDIEKIAPKFKYTQLKDIIYKTEILYEDDEDILDSEDNEYIKLFNEYADLFDLNKSSECESNWSLRITFDKISLISNNITISTIHEIIKQKGNSGEIQCSFNDDNASNIILRIGIKNKSDESSIDFIKEIEKSLGEMTIKGIKDIYSVYKGSSAHILKYKLDGSCSEEKDSVLYTEGSNLQKVLENDYVDTTKTITNNILEIYEIFGVEAARNHIILELSQIYENKPNPKHVQIISDLITYRGNLTKLNRNGINRKDDSGIISKASFEEIMNIFSKSAAFGEIDNMKGVSANVMAGQVCKSGTGSFDLLTSIEDLMDINSTNKSSKSSIEIDMADLDNLDDILIKEFKKNITINNNMFNFGLNMINDNIKISNQKLHNVKLDINNSGNNNIQDYHSSSEEENLGYSENTDVDTDTDNDNDNENTTDEDNVFGNDFEESDTDGDNTEENEEDENEEDEESESLELDEEITDSENDENEEENKENDENDKNDEEDEEDEKSESLELDEEITDSEDEDESESLELDEEITDSEDDEK